MFRSWATPASFFMGAICIVSSKALVIQNKASLRIGLVRWDLTPSPSTQCGFRTLFYFYDLRLCRLSCLVPKPLSQLKIKDYLIWYLYRVVENQA